MKSVTVGGPGTGLPSLDPRLLRAAALSLPDIAVPPLPAASGSPAGIDIVTPLPGDVATAALQLVLQTVDDRLSRTMASESARVVAPNASNTSLNHAAPADLYAHDGIMRDARISAEDSLAKAVHMLATGEARCIPEGADPRAVVALATQFIETGQYVNYLRAAELARIVVSWHDPRVPTLGRREFQSASAMRQMPAPSRVLSTVAVLWRRAPLLVLLVAWLVLGLLAGVGARVIDFPAWQMTRGVTVWATGFLALIVFQFVATLRGYLSGRRRGPSI